MTANEDMILYWNDVAGSKWVANQARLDRLMAPLSAALLDAAAPRAGEKIVEIGCGCGDVTLQLAALGSGGRITAVDVSRPMLAHAQARHAAMEGSAAAGDLASIDWVVADAMTYAFPRDNTLLLSRFGVMFFEDKPRAFANLRAALAPGGRFAFICWRPRAQCEWMQLPLDWVDPILPPPEETTGEPGPFGLADDAETVALLTDAGFTDVSADKVDCPLVMGEGATPEAAVHDAMALLGQTGPAARHIAEADPEPRRAALDLMKQRLAERVEDGRVLLEGACWIYSGRV